MNEKLISDTLVKAILSCLENRIDIPNEYINAFIARTMLVVQKEDRKQISTLYPRLSDSVFIYFRGHQYNEKELQESSANDMCVAYEKPNNGAFVFKMGQLHACITILNDMIRKQDENQAVITNKAYFVKNMSFFTAIANNPGIKHSELAKAVGKSPSGLSQFVLKIQQFDFFTQTVVGREKYYSLTNRGFKLFNELEIEKEKEKKKEIKESAAESKPLTKIAKTIVLEKSADNYYKVDEFKDLEKHNSLSQAMIKAIFDCLTVSPEYSNILKNRNTSISDAFKKEQEKYKLDAAIS